MADWDDIRIVMEVAQCGSLSAAAKALGVSHSTLSRRIDRVEARLGVRLFDRLPEGFVPTPAGQQMARSGQNISSEIAELDLSLAGRDTDLRGPLSITAPSLLIYDYLGDVIDEFAKQYPGIELHVNGSHANLDLHRREADIAVRATNNPPETLFGRKAAVQKRCCYASPVYLERIGLFQAGGRKDVALDWLGFDWWSREDIALLNGRLVATFDDMIALLGCLRAGMGVARLPCFVGDPDPVLQRVPGFEIESYVDFWLLCHPSLKDVARVRGFMRFAGDAFKRDAGLFEGTRFTDPV